MRSINNALEARFCRKFQIKRVLAVIYVFLTVFSSDLSNSSNFSVKISTISLSFLSLFLVLLAPEKKRRGRGILGFTLHVLETEGRSP